MGVVAPGEKKINEISYFLKRCQLYKKKLWVTAWRWLYEKAETWRCYDFL